MTKSVSTAVLAAVLMTLAVPAGAQDMDLATLKYRIGDHVGILQDPMSFTAWGDAEAQHGLGLMYDNGDEVPQDSVLAHVWINVAAVNGHASPPAFATRSPGKFPNRT